MKNIPKRIYLQLGYDPLPEDDFKDCDLECVTWSSERVNESDIEYFRKKILIPEEIPEFQKTIDGMPQSLKDKVDNTLLVQELLPLVRQFVHAQSRLQDDYAESSEQRKSALWKDLHVKGYAVFNFLDEQNLMHQ